jgi:hypothetical protein
MTWHAGRRRDTGHMWLRRVVRQEVRRFAEEAFATLSDRDEGPRLSKA